MVEWVELHSAISAWRGAPSAYFLFFVFLVFIRELRAPPRTPRSALLPNKKPRFRRAFTDSKPTYSISVSGIAIFFGVRHRAESRSWRMGGNSLGRRSKSCSKSSSWSRSSLRHSSLLMAVSSW